MRIGAFTDDKRLFEKLRLFVFKSYLEEIKKCTVSETGLEFAFVDLSARGSGEFRKHLDTAGTRHITLGEGGDIPLPFSHSELSKKISKADTQRSRLRLEGDSAVTLGNREIKLTSLEYKLLSCLVEAGGFVSRERLLSEVFGGGDGGMINVYIHYLRTKLETEGERIIISSRKEGYRVREDYLEGRTSL